MKPGYITMTQSQSNNQWSGGIAAQHAQINSKCENPLEMFSPQFFGIKTTFSSLIMSKLSMQSITHLCWCNSRTFQKEKCHEEGHQKGLVLAQQFPGSPGTCNPEETGLPALPMSYSPTLFSASGPVRQPPVSGTKKNERSPFFVRCGGHCCRGDLVGQTTFSIFFLSGLQKLEQQAKKCIELRGEYVE
jgi:hypothetical protein